MARSQRSDCLSACTLPHVVPANAGTHTPRPLYGHRGSGCASITQRQLANAWHQLPRLIDGSRGMGPCVRRDDVLRDNGWVCYPPMRTSSSSEDETEGTCSPSEAREMATRVLLKAASAPRLRIEIVEQLGHQHAVLALAVVGDLARRGRGQDQRVVRRARSAPGRGSRSGSGAHRDCGGRRRPRRAWPWRPAPSSRPAPTRC